MMDYKRNIDNIPHIRTFAAKFGKYQNSGDELWPRLDRIILLQPAGEDKRAVRRPRGACNVL